MTYPSINIPQVVHVDLCLICHILIFQISSSYPYSDALPKNTPALSEMSIVSDTASTKSLRLQLERSSISLNPGSAVSFHG